MRIGRTMILQFHSLTIPNIEFSETMDSDSDADAADNNFIISSEVDFNGVCIMV